jgi:hypothetical protein
VLWTWQVPKVPLLAPAESEAVMTEALFAGVRECLFLAEAEVKPRTPVDRGRLRSGWQTAAVALRGTPVTFHGVLQNPVPYAVPVELGQEPHWPPVQALEGWAQRKLGDKHLAWAVAAKIARRGVKGKFMVRETRKAITSRVATIIARALAQARAQLIGK